MEYAWSLIIGFINTWILLIFYKTVIKNREVRSTRNLVRLDDTMDFISVLSKDILLTAVLYHVQILLGLQVAYAWIILGILHVVVDFFIVNIYYRRIKI